MRPLSFVCFSLISLAPVSSLHADESRRFFDFTPISAENPIVATIDGDLRIPLSELRGYRDTERLNAITDRTSLPQKRAVLDALINEYLFVDEAYRTGVAQSPAFLKQMEATRTMLLTDFLSMRADEKAKTPIEPGDAGAAMADQLFEAASIEVSNEAYALLKRAANAVDVASAASQRGPVVESKEDATTKLRAIVDETPEATLVRYEHKTISVRQILVIYAGLAAPRPPLATEAGLIAMIKPLITPELMALEAVKRGLAADPEFKTKLIQNQNALLRFHMHGLIDRQANEVMQRPEAEAQLRAWYEAHQAGYAAPDAKGKNQIPSYAEARSRVEGDYSVDLRDRLLAEKAQALRKNRSVVIDEAVLEKL